MINLIRKESLFITPMDTLKWKDKHTINCEENYEFDENDCHITDQVKTFFETEEYYSENESNTTLDSLKRKEGSDLSNLIEETKSSLTNKFKISKLFKINLKEDILNFKDKLLNNIKNSLEYNVKLASKKKKELPNKLSFYNSPNWLIQNRFKTNEQILIMKNT